jgi:hypothetical protein
MPQQKEALKNLLRRKPHKASLCCGVVHCPDGVCCLDKGITEEIRRELLAPEPLSSGMSLGGLASASAALARRDSVSSDEAGAISAAGGGLTVVFAGAGARAGAAGKGKIKAAAAAESKGG